MASHACKNIICRYRTWKNSQNLHLSIKELNFRFFQMYFPRIKIPCFNFWRLSLGYFCTPRIIKNILNMSMAVILDINLPRNFQKYSHIRYIPIWSNGQISLIFVPWIEKKIYIWNFFNRSKKRDHVTNVQWAPADPLYWCWAR